MPVAVCCILVYTNLQSPFVLDSTAFTVDMTALTLIEQTLKGTAVDYCLDDFLYVLTARYLYKIDPDVLSIRDQIPLPQHFHYISTNSKKILLIASGEIIILDKKNLAFETGIGIEHGDFQPLTDAQGAGIAENDQTLYLIADSGSRSIVKIFNLITGALIKARSVKRILYYEYDPITGELLILDDSATITYYDTQLKVLRSVQLAVVGSWFEQHADGYLVYNKQGVFLANQNGKTVDFQPLPLYSRFGHEQNVFLTPNAVICLDPLTLRPRNFRENQQQLIKLIHIEPSLEYILAQDVDKTFFAVDLNTLTLTPLTRTRPLPMIPKPPVALPTSDSLWYIQLGAFAEFQNAQTLLDSLGRFHIPVFIDSTALYRVKLGGFLEKSEARTFIEISNFGGWLTYMPRVLQQNSKEFSINGYRYLVESGIIRRR